MESTLKYAKELNKRNKIELVHFGKNVHINVAEHSVRIFTKSGRRLITCDCENDSRFCNEPTICVHKIAAINFLLNQKRNEFVDKLIERYEKDVELGLPTESFAVLEELKTIRRII